MIYRGNELLGYVGSDDAWPCEPFEPADAFHQVALLFAKEHELAMKSAELSRTSHADEANEVMASADRVLNEILKPGVRFHHMDGSFAFDCIGLSIAEGRVCWR
jgi:hypothetical protein